MAQVPARNKGCEEMEHKPEKGPRSVSSNFQFFGLKKASWHFGERQ